MEAAWRGRNTFLAIYAQAPPPTLAQAACDSAPRTIANTPPLSHAGDKTPPSSTELYTTQPQHDEMATTSSAVPPHRRHQKPKLNQSSKKSPNQSWNPPPNGRAKGWPSKKDFPRPDPKRWTEPQENKWETDWDNEPASKWPNDNHDSWGSDRQDGWGRATDGNANGVKLTSWDNSWEPAPLDWDSRPAFRPDQSEEQVQRWVDSSEKILPDTPNRGINIEAIEVVDGTGFTFSTSNDSTTQLMGDIVPRYWIPTNYGRQDPQTFWDEMIKSDKPSPQDEGDLEGVRPWWELLQGRQFLEDLRKLHPSIAGIDPDETKEERLARENDSGGINHHDNRQKYDFAIEKSKKETKQRKTDRQKRLMAKACNSDRARNNKRLRPGMPRLFIRSARPEDMAEIRDIYNHYVRNSCATPETEDRTRDDMVQRYSDAIFSKLPFIVACQKGEVIKASKKKRQQEDIILPDKVVGFAVAEDYNDTEGMYRYTAHVEVYTDYRHYMKGVASCLMDKMIALLDPDFLERGGYDVHGDELEGKEPERVIKTILMHCPFEKPERLEWTKRWLSTSLNFEQVGQLDGIGTKLGRSVSLAILQRETGAQVDHANPPAVFTKKVEDAMNKLSV